MAALVFWWRHAANCHQFQTINLYREKRRLRRIFPLAFLTLAALALLGGALYPPTNYDALAYRLPRVLHWLAAERWHWIHTAFQRVNTRACGMEWLIAPLIVFTKSDRPLFLINFISFLLLPGLMFSILCRLGVRRRVAWFWMWLLPSGYCYLLQAGSIGNDIFSGTFALLAMDFALRARASRNLADLWLAVLAAAMLTAGKTSNLPLLLPWIIAVFPALPLLFNRIAVTITVCLVAAGASFLPMAVLNYKHCGDWSGAAAEQIVTGKGEILLHIEQNTLLLLVENLSPPIFPWSGAWNSAVEKWISPERAKRLAENFEPSQAKFTLQEMQTEEGTGLGMGVSGLLLISLLARIMAGLRRAKPVLPMVKKTEETWRLLACLTPYFSLIVFMVKVGLATIARLITPYYGLLAPAVLRGGTQERLAKNVLWQRAGLLVFLLAAILAGVTPARPLWPARTLLGKAGGKSPTLRRLQTVYSVYGERANCFDPAIKVLPPGLKILGMVTFDDPEAPLWKPFGERRIEHVVPDDTRASLQSRGIEYVLVSSDKFRIFFPEPFANWLARMDAEVVQTVPLDLRASVGPLDWYLVKLRPSRPSAGSKPESKGF